jgi:hypothetical protein
MVIVVISSLLNNIAVVVVIVHPLFKRNIYLSLLCDWISSF